MTESEPRFRLMGLEPSPYTMKVESFLKFKKIPYEWVSRSRKAENLFQTTRQGSAHSALVFPVWRNDAGLNADY